mgnify:CR=1 FL=1|jgi:hypothetical protein
MGTVQGVALAAALAACGGNGEPLVRFVRERLWW